MIAIAGRIRTESAAATHLAGALAPDNLPGMATSADEGAVVFSIEGASLRTVVSTVDDYLMNLAMAEEVCSLCGRSERYDRSGRML